jgi:hypothetical protein
MTQSPTPSTSRPPYGFFAVPQSPIPIPLSDSQAPAQLSLWLSRCPTDSNNGALSASVACAVSPLGPVADALLSPAVDGSSAASSTVPVALYGVQSVTSVRLACDPASAAPVPLGIAQSVGAYYGTGAGPGQLACAFTGSTAPSLLALSFQSSLTVRSTLWPVWEDAIVVVPTGLMRSIRFSRALNGSAALLAESPGSSTPSAALSDLTAVLAATRKTWQNVSLADASLISAARPFSLTLNGAAVIVLRAATRAFAPGMAAAMGLTGCTLGPVSNDGKWTVLITPTTSAACANATAAVDAAADCGYRSLVLNTTPVGGAALTCPPFCAGAVSAPSAVPMFPGSDGSSGFVLGSYPPPGSGLPPVPLPGQGSADTSLGFYYAKACSAAGEFGAP